MMIDFNNASYFKLKPVPNTDFLPMVQDLLVPREEIVSCFRGIRDGVVFTSRRVIAINVQGITGKKKDFTSLPYSKIQAFSIETAGVFDLDSELILWFSGLGQVKFEFVSRADIGSICRIISDRVF